MTWLSTRHHIAGIVAVLLMMTGLADGLLLDEQRASNLKSSRVASAALASSYADGFSYWTKHIDDQLVSCRKNLASRGDGLLAGANVGGPVSVFQKKLLTTCNHGLDGIGAFVLYDANGQAYASSTGHFPAGNALSKDDVFRELKAGGTDVLRLSRPMAGSSASLSFYGVRRLVRADGGFAGVIAAEFLISVTEAYLGRTLPAPRRVIYARRDGTILLRYPSTASDAISTVPAESPWYAAVKAGGGSYLSGDSALQPATLAAVQLVSPLPLVIEVSMLRHDALADYERRKPLIIAVGVAIAAAIVLLGYFVAAQYARIENAQRKLADKNALLEATQSQLQATLGNISQGVSFFGSDMRLIVSNRRYAEMYELDPDRVVPGITLADIVGMRVAAGTAVARSPEEYIRLISTVPDHGQDRIVTTQLRDGRTIAIQQRRMEGGGWVATHEDITERRRAEAEIAFLARHDVLTGLPNRSVLQEFIERALPEAERGGRFAILFLDLDRFKAVNDTLGHRAGDELLKQVSARLRAAVRQTDTIARFGGDEFVILQPLVDSPDAAMRLAERIIDVVGQPYVLEGVQASIGVSVGIAMAPADGSTAGVLLKNADMALYLAKTEGRGTFRFFEPEMDAKLTRRHDIERDLRTAIAEDRLELHYQPIMNLHSGAVRAFEALIRWNHPVLGRLSPAEFIGIAEDCGLIGAVGEWVLREACRQATHWPDAIGLTVNLSPLQFRDGALVESMSGILRSCGLAQSRLEVEITETVLLAGSQANIATLHRLRALGVSIAMDDFGVGYSSLSYLHSFPFDRVKIDGSFVANMMHSREALFIVRAIIGLCHDLGVSTTAEGVETREQLRVLRDEMASEGQGYYFAKPMPAAQIPAFLGRAPVAPIAWTQAAILAAGT